MSAPEMNLMMAPETVHALGWTLVAFVGEGMLVALVLWCGLQLLPASKSRLRYALACAALLAMCALPMVTFAHLRTTPEPAGLRLGNEAGPVTGGMVLPGEETSWRVLGERLLAMAERRFPDAEAVWAMGVLLSLLRMGAGVAAAARLRRVGTAAVPAALRATMERLAERMGVRRPVRLLCSMRVEAPTLVGWLRPVVLLPLGCLAGLSAAQMEALLAHELAHIRRHDYAVNAMQRVAEALLFYHPAVWWVSATVRQERESCCDDAAIAISGDALGYGRALAMLESRRGETTEMTMGANGGRLAMRIRRVLGYKETGSPATAMAVLVVLAGLGIAMAARAQSGTAAAPAIESARTGEGMEANGSDDLAGLPAAYRSWLNEDVVWVIAPAERAEFAHLRTDAERDAYISSFWLRHDAAGAPAGSYKAEHYRRLAYANGHFADKRAGWQTDRGRIYVIDGAPSSVDAHPLGDGSGEPYEVWTYATAAGETSYRFADRCRCGEYDLQAETTAGADTAEAMYRAGAGRMREGESAVARAQYTEANARFAEARLQFERLIRERPESALLQPARLAIAESWESEGGHPAEAERAYGVAGAQPRPVGAAVKAPELRYQTEPEYTVRARDEKLQGTVSVELWVDQQGAVSHVRVVHGLGNELDQKAVEAVRQYRFKPATEEGAATVTAVKIDVNFQIF